MLVAPVFYKRFSDTLPGFSKLMLLAASMRLSASSNEQSGSTSTWIQAARRSRLECYDVHANMMVNLNGKAVKDLKTEDLEKARQVWLSQKVRYDKP